MLSEAAKVKLNHPNPCIYQKTDVQQLSAVRERVKVQKMMKRNGQTIHCFSFSPFNIQNLTFSQNKVTQV